MKKKLFTLLAAACMLSYANAQVSSYSFTQSTGVYAQITGGLSLGSSTDDEQLFVDDSVPLGGFEPTGVGFPIGFGFTYNGIIFDRFAINTNGWISLGQSALTPSVDISSTTSYGHPLSSTSMAEPAFLRNRISGLGADLEGQTGSEIRVETIGTVPNRVCVIQWTKYSKYGSTGNDYNFQIRLNETTNFVDIVYGTMTNASASILPEVGLGGIVNNDFNNRTTTTDWAATTAGTSNAGSCTLSSTVFPVSGQTFTWTPAPQCSGTPIAGTASASADSVCNSENFDLVLSGYSSNVSGITFQWQSSADSITFNNIEGATAALFTYSQIAANYYHCIVTCTASGVSSTSNTIYVGQMECYCVPTLAQCDFGDEITNVTFVTINNTSDCSSNGYSFYPGTSPLLYQGENYPCSVTIGSGGTEFVGVWIDFDQNNSFDSTEFSYSGSGIAEQLNFTVIVPASATIGSTRMRVRVRYDHPFSGNDACTEFSYGETEDYEVTIIFTPPCTGTPTAGTASAPVAACTGVNFDLELTNYSANVTGLIFQWQSSPTGLDNSFANLSGGTTPSFATMQTATTYYKCIVSCTTSGESDTSNVISVGMNVLMDCHCIPPPTNCYSYNDDITNVIFATINNATICSPNGYSYYASPNPVLFQGHTYIDSVTIDVGDVQHVGVWIDYDQSGSYEPSEFTDLGGGEGEVLADSITIPLTATVGETKMRVRSRYNTPLTGNDACLSYTWGETEDYKVTIAVPSGIDEMELKGVSIFPNPTTGILNVNFRAETSALNVKLVNVAGQLIYNENVEHFSGAYSSRINIAEQAKGIYFLQITSDNKVTTKKVVLY